MSRTSCSRCQRRWRQECFHPGPARFSAGVTHGSFTCRSGSVEPQSSSPSAKLPSGGPAVARSPRCGRSAAPGRWRVAVSAGRPRHLAVRWGHVSSSRWRDRAALDARPPAGKWGQVLIKRIFRESSVNISQTVGIFKCRPLGFPQVETGGIRWWWTSEKRQT